MEIATVQHELEGLRLKYEGNLRIPKRIHVNTNYEIGLTLTCVAFHLRDYQVAPSIQFEIEAPGVRFTSRVKQKRELSTKGMAFVWRCVFHTSGRMKIWIRSSVENAGEVSHLGEVSREILVVSLDHLTSRHLQVASFIFGIAGTAVGFAALVVAYMGLSN